MNGFKGKGEYIEEHGFLISHIFMPAIFMELSMSSCRCHKGADYGGGMENTENLLIAVAFWEPAEIMTKYS